MKKAEQPIHPHVGLAAYRLAPDAGNPREVAFALQWSKEQQQGRILLHLIGKDISERDAVIVATVIQWLGSNVGMSFIEETAKREPRIREFLKARLQ